MSSPSPTPSPPYELIYWPTIPGRAEHIRLALEATRTPYTDLSNSSSAIATIQEHTSPTSAFGSAHNPPPFAPPILRHGALVLSQTPNILLYLGPRLGLVPDTANDPHGLYHVNALALTALDGLSNEAHDTHHPVAVSAYYEEQKEEAKRRAADYVAQRLPKFLAYFERVLARSGEDGDREASGWLYGLQMTYADLVLFQTVDGLGYAFPKAVARLREGGKYARVFALVGRVREGEAVREYLASGRRKAYGMGVYRFYEELDLVGSG